MDLKMLKTTQSRIDILNAMNIFTLEDVLQHYPYRYEVIEETYPTDNRGLLYYQFGRKDPFFGSNATDFYP